VKLAVFIENEYIATTETKAKCKILKNKVWIKCWWNATEMYCRYETQNTFKI